MTLLLQSGQQGLRPSHSWMQHSWKRWPHGSVSASSCRARGSRQMQHPSAIVLRSGVPWPITLATRCVRVSASCAASAWNMRLSAGGTAGRRSDCAPLSSRSRCTSAAAAAAVRVAHEEAVDVDVEAAGGRRRAEVRLRPASRVGAGRWCCGRLPLAAAAAASL